MILGKMEEKMLKKILSTLTAVAVTIFVSSGSLQTVVNEIRVDAAENEVIYGDINNDGNIDSFDVIAIRRLLNSGNTSETYKSADLNGNNIVDAVDMYLLQSYVIGKIDSFPIEIIEINNSIDRTLALYDGEHYELAMTYEMAVAAEILKTPLNIYDYLSNNIKTEFYPNSRKGAIGTFELNGGNDVDCASLLIAMLNYVGINSRYVTGNITLSIDTAMNLTGAHDANSALNILKFWDNNATLSSDNSSITLAHTWVKSVIDGKTYNLDCSFKQYTYHDTIFDELNEQYDFKDEGFNINDAIEEQAKCPTQRSYIIDKQIDPVNNNQLPEKLPYSNVPAGGYDFVTPENSDTVTIILPGGNGLICSSSQLYNKKITLQYEVNHDFVDDEDLGPLYLSSVTEGETIYELMDDYRKDSPLKTAGAQYGDMELVLRIDGQKYDNCIGTPGNLGKSQNAVVKIKTMGKEIEYEKECFVGSTYSVILDYQNMASYKMVDDIKEIDKIKDSVNTSNLFKTNNIGRLLEFIGDTYYSELDVMNNMIAEQSDIYLTRGLSAIFTGFEPSITFPNLQVTSTNYTVKDSGDIIIDVIANNYNMISKNSDTELELRAKQSAGLISSQLESSVIDQLFDIQSVSTASILDYSIKNNIPIHFISNHNKNELDSLSINENAKNKIKERIANGKIITVPEKDIAINSWNGCGYVSYDPQSGFSEYMLSRHTTSRGGCSSASVKLEEIVAMFFSCYAFTGSAAFLASSLGLISFTAAAPVVAPLSVIIFSIAMLALSVAAYIYTCDLLYRVDCGDESAYQELQFNNKMDIAFTCIGAVAPYVAKSCNTFIKEAKAIKYTEKYGSKAVEGAMKHSDDMADAFRTAEKLEKKKLNGALLNALLEHGDGVLDSVNAISKNSDDLIDAMNKSRKSPEEIAREFNILNKHRPNVSLPEMDSIFNASLRTSTRQLNDAENASDVIIKNLAIEFRKNIGTQKTNGNLALSINKINGVPEKIYSYSSFDDLNEATKFGATINEEEFKVAWLPKKSSFECFEVANNVKGGKPYLRIHDTEYKILSEIDKILNGDINATGKITLFTEKTCCESCSDVIAQFSQKYPNIEIEVIHNNNIPVI